MDNRSSCSSFAFVLAILAMLVPVSVFVKPRLAPTQSGADLTLVGVAVLMIWVVLHPIPVFRQLSRINWRSPVTWIAAALMIYPLVHAYVFGADILQLGRWVILVAPVFLVCAIYLGSGERSLMLIVPLIGFLGLSVLGVLEINSPVNANRFVSLGISTILSGQAAGFGMLCAMIYGAWRGRVSVAISVLCLFAAIAVLAGSKGPILSVLGLAIVACALAAAMGRRAIASKGVAMIAISLILLAGFIYTPLLSDVPKVTATLNEQALKEMLHANATVEQQVNTAATQGTIVKRATIVASQSMSRLAKAAAGRVDTSSVGSRLRFWTEGAKIALRHPLGIGLGRLGPILSQTLGFPVRYAHNLLIGTWAELGVPGLLLLAFVLIAALLGYLREFRKKPDDLWTIAALLAFLYWVGNGFISGDLTGDLMLFAFAGAGITTFVKSKDPLSREIGCKVSPGPAEMRTRALSRRSSEA